MEIHFAVSPSQLDK